MYAFDVSILPSPYYEPTFAKVLIGGHVVAEFEVAGAYDDRHTVELRERAVEIFACRLGEVLAAAF